MIEMRLLSQAMNNDKQQIREDQKKLEHAHGLHKSVQSLLKRNRRARRLNTVDTVANEQKLNNDSMETDQ